MKPHYTRNKFGDETYPKAGSSEYYFYDRNGHAIFAVDRQGVQRYARNANGNELYPKKGNVFRYDPEWNYPVYARDVYGNEMYPTASTNALCKNRREVFAQLSGGEILPALYASGRQRYPLDERGNEYMPLCKITGKSYYLLDENRYYYRPVTVNGYNIYLNREEAEELEIEDVMYEWVDVLGSTIYTADRKMRRESAWSRVKEALLLGSCCFYTIACQEFLMADPYVTKETIQQRVLDKVKNMLGLNDKKDNENWIHPKTSAFLNKHFPPSAFDIEDSNLVRKIYSTDRHDSETLREFCNLLEKMINSENKRHVYRAFAVDGFRGDKIAEYVDNLRFPVLEEGDEEEPTGDSLEKHVRAVRQLYEEFDISVQTVAIVLRNVMDYVESSDETLRKMTNKYLTLTIRGLEDIQRHFNAVKNEAALSLGSD